MWVASWLWNWVGCALMVGLLYASGIFHHKDWCARALRLLLQPARARAPAPPCLHLPPCPRLRGALAADQPPARARARRYAKTLAVAKVSHGWGEVLIRAVFANWLVCIATWQANAAQDLTGARALRPAAACGCAWPQVCTLPAADADAADSPPPGKAVAIWLPIMAFAAIGFEHCIGGGQRALRQRGARACARFAGPAPTPPSCPSEQPISS